MLHNGDTHPIALHAALCKVLFIARYADHLLVTRDKALVPNRLLAHLAEEALLVPLLATVFILLHTYKKHSVIDQTYNQVFHVEHVKF